MMSTRKSKGERPRYPPRLSYAYMYIYLYRCSQLGMAFLGSPSKANTQSARLHTPHARVRGVEASQIWHDVHAHHKRERDQRKDLKPEYIKSKSK
jgi:hypothetical protein